MANSKQRTKPVSGKRAAAVAKAGGSRYRILSLDGGGIRGLITAVWLKKLEDMLGKPLAGSFEIIAGTSTGSILAAAIAAGVPMQRIIDMYRDNGREIFPGTAGRLWSRFTRTFTQGPSAPKYSDAGLATVLRRILGERTFGQPNYDPNAPKPLLLITTYNTMAREAQVFKNNRPDCASLPLWEIVKSSCSAPTYFPAHVMKLSGANVPLIDGGVVANNPVACAIAEGVRLNSELKANGAADPEPCEIERFIVGSFGTGALTRPISIESAREWGALEWVIPIIDVLFDGAGDAAHYIANNLVPKGRYIRLQTDLDAAYDDMDNADATNLNALVSVANAYLETKGDGLLDDLKRMID